MFVRRGLVLVVLGMLATAVLAAAPERGARPRAAVATESGELHGIASWLRLQGRDGYIGADVADAMGIARPRDGELLAARQRGFRTDDEVRIVQIAADGESDFLLFMVHRPDDQIYFYLSTMLGGLQRALLSIPSKNMVVPLEAAEAEARWRAEVHFWSDRSSQ